MNLSKILIALCSLLFLTIGPDKFFPYLEPPCSLMDRINPMAWKFIGVLQIAAGILIWLPKFRNYVVGFFFVFMIIFTVIHFSQNTSDFGGSLFMGVLLGMLVWNPSFINRTFSSLIGKS